MPDREKVIKGLEYCAASCKGAWDENNGCPYMADFIKLGADHNGRCVDLLCEDALTLLKAQEPRVLALDEIHRGMVVWLEDVDKADVVLAIGGSSAGGCKCFITVNEMSIAPHDSDYGVRWRAWTQEPTDEQRDAVKWDG